MTTVNPIVIESLPLDPLKTASAHDLTIGVAERCTGGRLRIARQSATGRWFVAVDLLGIAA